MKTLRKGVAKRLMLSLAVPAMLAGCVYAPPYYPAYYDGAEVAGAPAVATYPVYRPYPYYYPYSYGYPVYAGPPISLSFGYSHFSGHGWGGHGWGGHGWGVHGHR